MPYQTLNHIGIGDRRKIMPQLVDLIYDSQLFLLFFALTFLLFPHLFRFVLEVTHEVLHELEFDSKSSCYLFLWMELLHVLIDDRLLFICRQGAAMPSSIFTRRHSLGHRLPLNLSFRQALRATSGDRVFHPLTRPQIVLA